MLLTLLIICLHTPAPIATGWSYHYRPWPDPYGRSMRQVAQVRGMRLLPDVAGYVSTRDCTLVDTAADPSLRVRPWRVWARIGRVLDWWQVVDCSAPQDWALQDRLGLVIETDWWSARPWAIYGGLHGPGRTFAAVYSYAR